MDCATRPECQRCGMYTGCLSPAIPGRGAEPATIMFLGEAPGRDEDEAARCFVGMSGYLLDLAIQTYELPEDQIFRTNTVKCRPSDNKLLQAKKRIECCAGLLLDEIDRVRPRILVPMGATATSALLGEGKITLLHGRALEQDGFLILPMYHPAAVIRDPTKQGAFDHDFSILRRLFLYGKVEPDPVDDGLVTDFDQVIDLIGQCLDRRYTCIDYETNCLKPWEHPDPRIGLVSLSLGTHKGRAFPLDDWQSPWKTPWTPEQRATIVEALRILLTDPNMDVVAHNAKYETMMTQVCLGFRPKPLRCSMIAHSHIDENAYHNLDDLAWRWTDLGGYKDDFKQHLADPDNYLSATLEQLAAYGSRDVTVGERVDQAFLERLSPEQRKILQLQEELIPVLAQVELRGKAVDEAALTNLDVVYTQTADAIEVEMRAWPEVEVAELVLAQQRAEKTVEKLREEMAELQSRPLQTAQSRKAAAWRAETISKIEAGDPDALASYRETFNFRSDPQMQTLILDPRCFGWSPTRFTTDSGAPSIGKDSLVVWGRFDPRAQVYRRYRRIRHSHSQFIAPMYDYVGNAKDRRVHASYNQAVARTGRLCVAGDTVLVTDRGNFEISKLDLTNFQNVAIVTHQGRRRKILRRYYKGQEQLYRVASAEGHIVCTAGHRFLTPDGWQHLGDLHVGSRVARASGVHLRGGGRGSEETSDRGVVFCFGRGGSHQKGDEREVPGVHVEVLAAVPEGVSGIRGEVAGAETAQLFSVGLPETETSFQGASCPVRPIRFRDPGAGGPVYPGNGEAFAHYRVLCEEESLVARPRDGQEAPLQVAAGQQRRLGPLGVSCAGFEGESRELLFRPTRVLSGDVRGAVESVRSGVVHKESEQISRLPYICRENTERSHLLVLEPVRSTGIDGLASPRGEAHTAVRVLQELPGGFPDCGYEDPCGDRRGVPQTGADKRSGREEGSCRREVGVQGPSVFYEASGGRFCKYCGRSSCRYFQRIEAIDFAGVGDVWDIEVEGDSSYIAGGFVNHNSCSDPNEQNRIRDDTCKVLGVPPLQTAMYCSRWPDGEIVKGDYSQLELRVLASASQDTRLIEAYQRGWDLHAVTTLRFFHDLPDGCDDAAYQACLKIAAQDAVRWKVERSIGKRCNFLTGYGGSGLRLQALLAEQGIYLSEEECDRYVELFFEVYPGVRTYMDGVVMAAKANGGNCLAGDGRVRHLPALLAGSPGDMAEAARQAGNHTIQWPAAKLTMLALIRLEARLEQEQMGTLVIGSIHDSIILDSPAGEQDRARDLLREEMEAAALDPRWMPAGWLDPRIQILADVE